jgi:hypothetical protein
MLGALLASTVDSWLGSGLLGDKLRLLANCGDDALLLSSQVCRQRGIELRLFLLQFCG